MNIDNKDETQGVDSKLNVPDLMTEAGKKNTHMAHLEDLVILEGKSGVASALQTCQSLINNLTGHVDDSRSVSLKIDGAPSVLTWSSFPGLEPNGLSLKGLFARSPKAAYDHNSVVEVFGKGKDGAIREDLVTKLDSLLAVIPQMNIPPNEIWQGDFLFSKADLNVESINGEEYVTCHPNTLVYAAKTKSELGQKMMSSEAGVAWHTIYRGPDVENASASYDANVNNLANVPTLFSTNSDIPNLSGQVSFTTPELAEVNANMEKAKQLQEQINGTRFEDIVANQKFVSNFYNVFQNKLVRDQRSVAPENYMDEFRVYCKEKLDKARDKKLSTAKTDRGRNNATTKHEEDLNTIDMLFKEYGTEFSLIINLIQTFTDIKAQIMPKLDNLGKFETYLRKHDGMLQQTGQEGFAVSDIDQNIVKLVDRNEFSYANFSTEVVKGWENKRVAENVQSDLADQVDQLVEPLGLNRRSNIVKKKDSPGTFHTEIEAPAGVGRKQAAIELADVASDIVTEKDIPLGGARPVVTLNLAGNNIMLNFKDNAKTPTKLDAKMTEAMETAWAICMAAKSNNKEYPTFEALATIFPKIDDAWYEGFKSGAEAIKEKLLTPGMTYIFSREGTTLPEQDVSIHKLINATFARRKDVFMKIGSKKDAWNPADVYACRTDKYDEMVAKWTKKSEDPATTIEDFNLFLVEGIEQKTLIGISLKKPTKSDDIHTEHANMTREAISSVDYTLTKLAIDLKLNPSFIGAYVAMDNPITGNEINGGIRYFGSSDKGGQFCGSLQIELKEKGAKAQLGKVPQGIVKSWAATMGIIIPNKKQAIASLNTMLSDQRDNVASIEQAFPGLNIKLADFDQTIADATQKYGNIVEAFKVETDDSNKRELIHLSQLPIAISQAAVFAQAQLNGELVMYLNDIVNGAKKVGADNAPFVKVS